MRGFEMLASVIIAFFVIGVGVGVLLVVALPAPRQCRRRDARDIGWDGDSRRRYGLPPGYGDQDGPGWQEPPGPDDDTRPRWPGGTSA